MYRRGYTIVELLIVIALMGILLTLGVVNLRSSQANSRDNVRTENMRNLALHLETYYTSGNGSNITIGSYPPTVGFVGNETTLMPNLDSKSLIAPGQSGDSVVVSTGPGTPTAGVNILPSIFIYQPLTQAGGLCTLTTTPCQKFNLFYETEVDKVVRTISSKNQ